MGAEENNGTIESCVPASVENAAHRFAAACAAEGYMELVSVVAFGGAVQMISLEKDAANRSYFVIGGDFYELCEVGQGPREEGKGMSYGINA